MERRIVELLLVGRGVKSICKALGVGKDRVRAARAKARERGYLGGDVPLPMPPEALFADFVDGRSHKQSEADRALCERLGWIRERLEAGWRPITVFEELGCAEVSRSSFYRFFERHGLFKLSKLYRARELVAPIVHEPGEALILDWGKVCDVEEPGTKRKRTLWAFVGVLGYSRYMMVRLVWTNDVTTTLTAIESMLREIGGVTVKVTSDNPKCFSLTADRYEPILNPAFERFSAHYGFVIECLPPGEPKKKGKVERLMPFVRRIFEAYPKGEWQNLAHAEAYMDRKVGIANLRRHGTTCQQPKCVFDDKEAPVLKPLPPLKFERCEVSYPTVRRDAMVRVMNKYYAVPDRFIGEEMTALLTDSEVAFYHKGKLTESYTRLTSLDAPHAIKEHLQKSWQKVKENNLHYLKQGGEIGLNAHHFIEILLSRGHGFVDTRRIWGLLSLEKKYSREAIDWACAIAIDVDRLSSRFVEQMLALRVAQNAEPTGPASKSDSSAIEQNSTALAPSKFARSMEDYKKQLSQAKH